MQHSVERCSKRNVPSGDFSGNESTRTLQPTRGRCGPFLRLTQLVCKDIVKTPSRRRRQIKLDQFDPFKTIQTSTCLRLGGGILPGGLSRLQNNTKQH